MFALQDRRISGLESRIIHRQDCVRRLSNNVNGLNHRLGYAAEPALETVYLYQETTFLTGPISLLSGLCGEVC